ncbi:MAG: Ig-like domain-containing protein [Gemmatimonadaceae bacterium]
MMLPGLPSRRAKLAPAFCVLLIAACKLTSDPPRPYRMVITSPEPQTTAVGTALPAPLAVAVVDQYGVAMSDITVTWAITAGGGALSATSTQTDENGRASVTYTAGTTAGTATITATVSGLGTLTFTETITP